MTPRGRPRQFDPDAVLDHALAVFWRDGYEGASINEIADATGVSKPSLYAAFGDKESLYLKALERYAEGRRQKQAVVLESEPDARKAIEAFLLSVVEAQLDPQTPGGCMVVTGATTSDGATVPESVRRAVRSTLEAGGQAIAQRLTRAQHEGQLSGDVDVLALATFFNTVLAGLGVQAKGRQCRDALRGVVTSAMRAWPTAATVNTTRRTTRRTTRLGGS